MVVLKPTLVAAAAVRQEVSNHEIEDLASPLSKGVCLFLSARHLNIYAFPERKERTGASREVIPLRAAPALLGGHNMTVAVSID